MIDSTASIESIVYRIGIPLLLIVVANSAAWAAAQLIGARWATPLDCGITLRDGSRLLGDHKTWRGLTAASIACGVAAQLLGLGFRLGAAFGALALLGDALSSFAKRRLRLSPGAEVPGLDQIPEAILPLIILQQYVGVGLVDSLIVTTLFAALDISATRLRRRQ
jgi:CDP-2,3-bis-(O-geranylgeranyl)-sn-glycerol synthase